MEVSPDTIADWAKVFERFYAAFFVSPVQIPKIRTLKKDRKIYLWDWAKADLPGAILENLVALHLLRFCHWARDVEGLDLDLRYFRDVQGREVDFIITKKRQPWIAIEVKSSEQELDPNLRYYLERQKVEFAFQVHLKGNIYQKLKSINGALVRIMPVRNFLVNLP